MYGVTWPAEPAIQPVAQVTPRLLEMLQQVAAGKAPLAQAFQVLAHHQDELMRNAADLREREVWALSVILAISSPLWQIHRIPRYGSWPVAQAIPD